MKEKEFGMLACPKCGHRQREKVPNNRCVISYICKGCGETIFAEGSCCVFCEYSNTKCPVSYKS